MPQKKILIVDDEKFVTDALEGFFHSKGYEIFKAQDGQAALKIIETQPLDLVLLDIKLPKINGIEILTQLRKHYPQTKIIVMTAYDIEYKNKADELGYDAFFIKPLLIDELTQKTEELLLSEKTSVLKDQFKTSIHSTESPAAPASALKSPRARILIVSPRTLVSSLLKDYFSDSEVCNGVYEVDESGLAELTRIKRFNPDIILLDIALIGLFGEFGLTLMKLPSPPKEIILFGDPSQKWEEVEVLTKRGTKFIGIPADLHNKKGYPIRDTIERLNSAVKDVCVKHCL